MAVTAIRDTLRKQTRRNRKSYREPLTDSEDEITKPPPKRTLPYRASRAFQNAYDEPSSDESSSSSEGQVEVRLSPRITRSKAPVSRKRKSPESSQGDTSLLRQLKIRKVASPLPLQKPVTASITIPVLGKIPAWQTLPYHVLLSIMQFAAYPLYTGASRDTGTARWLLETSELCHSFHEACIGALMYSPPLFPADRAHHVIRLLTKSAEHYGATSVNGIDNATIIKRRLSTDYRPKVKSLEIEVRALLIKKSGIDLDDLVRHTPLLKHLCLYHNYDVLAKKYIWAQYTYASVKRSHSYTYGKLFEALDSGNVHLQSFEFNGRFLTDDPLLFGLRDACCDSTSLRSLRSIALRNLDLPNIANLNETVARDHFLPNAEYPGPDVDASSAQLLTWRINILKALAASPDLKHVAIHDASILDDSMLSDFPGDLESLTITSCGFIKSEGLHQWLQQKGSSLKKLVLRSNLCLNLSFMKDLATTAPHLQELEIDLTFHDASSFKDTEPLFDELLPDGPPTWPSTLETISISPLRTLSADDAEKFYQSLIDAAPAMPFLRVLQLRTILSQAGWRDRATLRQKWEARIRGTFLSRAKMPQQERPGRKSKRLVDVSSTEESDLESDYGRGHCHTVLFDLSDQRPAQDQYTEQDFLDDDPEEDDGEWNGRDSEPPRYSASRRFALR